MKLYPHEFQKTNKGSESIVLKPKFPRFKNKSINWRKWLLILMAFFTISTIIMLILFGANRHKFIQKQNGYGVWVSKGYKYGCDKYIFVSEYDKWALPEFGRPRHQGKMLYKYNNGISYIIIDYDISSLGYSVGAENEYLCYVLQNTFLARMGEVCLQTDYDGKHYIQFTSYYFDHGYGYNNDRIHKHRLYCHHGVAYEIIVDSPVNEQVDEVPYLYYENPNKDILYIPILLYSFIVLLSLSIIALGINFILTNKRKQIKNYAAHILSWYINISMIVSSIIFAVVMIDGIEIGGIFCDMGLGALLLYCSMVVTNIPMLFYVSDKIEQEYTFDYLVPQWLKSSIKKYLKNMAAMRACVVFLVYPVAYVATLPLGICAYMYIIPAFLLFYLCIFIFWIIEGRNTAIE